jgi:hypothetical protein
VAKQEEQEQQVRRVIQEQPGQVAAPVQPGQVVKPVILEQQVIRAKRVKQAKPEQPVKVDLLVQLA